MKTHFQNKHPEHRAKSEVPNFYHSLQITSSPIDQLLDGVADHIYDK